MAWGPLLWVTGKFSHGISSRDMRLWTERVLPAEVRDTDMRWLLAMNLMTGRSVLAAGELTKVDSGRIFKGMRNPRSSRRYRTFRANILAEQPLCRTCEAEGRTVEAVELDHIIPVHQAPERVMDPDNVQPLCVECHSRKTRRGNHRIVGATLEGDLRESQ